MKNDIELIFILMILLFWITLLSIITVNDLNKKKRFIKTIKHELMHARIFERFGFKKWNIKKTKDSSMTCTVIISKEKISPKSFIKILLMLSIQFIYDLGMLIIFIAIVIILRNIKEYISQIKQLIICTIKK